MRSDRRTRGKPIAFGTRPWASLPWPRRRGGVKTWLEIPSSTRKTGVNRGVDRADSAMNLKTVLKDFSRRRNIRLAMSGCGCPAVEILAAADRGGLAQAPQADPAGTVPRAGRGGRGGTPPAAPWWVRLAAILCREGHRLRERHRPLDLLERPGTRARHNARDRLRPSARPPPQTARVSPKDRWTRGQEAGVLPWKCCRCWTSPPCPAASCGPAGFHLPPPEPAVVTEAGPGRADCREGRLSANKSAPDQQLVAR